jgi:hypothetical protein
MERLPSKLAWKRLAKGRWKTDLGGTLPEVVILRMSNSEFQKFRKSKKSAMAYHEKRHYFKRKLLNVIFAHIVRCPRGGEWLVIGIHTLKSTVVIVGWQIP